MRRKREPIVRYFKTFPGEVWGETVRMGAWGGDWPIFWYNRKKTVVYRIGGSYGGPIAYDPRGMEPTKGGKT